VAGSAVFQSPDPVAAVREMKRLTNPPRAGADRAI